MSDGVPYVDRETLLPERRSIDYTATTEIKPLPLIMRPFRHALAKWMRNSQHKTLSYNACAIRQVGANTVFIPDLRLQFTCYHPQGCKRFYPRETAPFLEREGTPADPNKNYDYGYGYNEGVHHHYDYNDNGWYSTLSPYCSGAYMPNNVAGIFDVNTDDTPTPYAPRWARIGAGIKNEPKTPEFFLAQIKVAQEFFKLKTVEGDAWGSALIAGCFPWQRVADSYAAPNGSLYFCSVQSGALPTAPIIDPITYQTAKYTDGGGSGVGSIGAQGNAAAAIAAAEQSRNNQLAQYLALYPDVTSQLSFSGDNQWEYTDSTLRLNEITIEKLIADLTEDKLNNLPVARWSTVEFFDSEINNQPFEPVPLKVKRRYIVDYVGKKREITTNDYEGWEGGDYYYRRNTLVSYKGSTVLTKAEYGEFEYACLNASGITILKSTHELHATTHYPETWLDTSANNYKKTHTATFARVFKGVKPPLYENTDVPIGREFKATNYYYYDNGAGKEATNVMINETVRIQLGMCGNPYKFNQDYPLTTAKQLGLIVYPNQQESEYDELTYSVAISPDLPYTFYQAFFPELGINHYQARFATGWPKYKEAFYRVRSAQFLLTEGALRNDGEMKQTYQVLPMLYTLPPDAVEFKSNGKIIGRSISHLAADTAATNPEVENIPLDFAKHKVYADQCPANLPNFATATVPYMTRAQLVIENPEAPAALFGGVFTRLGEMTRFFKKTLLD